MKVLVLGGTGFVGRSVVEECLRQGWTTATFNRGLSAPDVAGVKILRGDRHDLAAVASLADSGPWDAVVDCSGYVPRNVLEVSRLLSPATSRYVFVSTVSAYAGWPVEPLTEDSAVLEAPADAGPDFGVDVEDGPTRYGYQKAGCEVAVRLAVGAERSVILRPGVVLGPREYVGRLIWWLNRMRRGGRVVGPGSPGRTIQPVDVRDVAGFVCTCVREGLSGDFNVTAPIGSATFGGLLADCVRVTGGEGTVQWVDDELLLSLGVRQWSEMPLWRVSEGVWQVSSDRAVAAGLLTRSLADTIEDTWRWMQSGDTVDGRDRAAEVGLTAYREVQLLQALDARVAQP